ncbi:MAG TPA: DJ-1/PfpI family protein [Thermoanaerobaculia bacterium]
MSDTKKPFIIAIPVYEGVDLLDVAPPYEIFYWMGQHWQERSVEVYLVAERKDVPIFTLGRFQLTPHKTFDELDRVDLFWVPGGNPPELAKEMQNPAYIGALRHWAKKAEWVTSVCGGSMLLGAAGLLDGHEATTHWAFLPCFERFPNVRVAPGHPRYVQSGNRVTGGGISSSMDEALGVVILVAGEEVAKAVQLMMQYFPEPPVTGVIPEVTHCDLPPTAPVGRA